MSGSAFPAGSDLFAAVVVAAGRSTRMPGDIPKQYRVVAGRSVLERAVAALHAHRAVTSIVVVLPAEDLEGPRGRRAQRWPGVITVVAGGATRADSVRRGLEAVGAAPFVLVHDGARPGPTPALLERVIAATRAHGAVIPALRPTDTIKTVDEAGRIERTLDRRRLLASQTPQGFRSDWLRVALERADGAEPAPTDESAALEAAGFPVCFVDGEPGNRKITRAEDLRAVRLELEGDDVRVGTGFDIHRTAAGRPMVLGGVTFDCEVGLDGHSDADVVLHAAMDAVLGAAGLDDIGAHFPPDDDRFRGASSVDLTRQVAAMLARAGWRVVNLDLTVLGERPKIRPRVTQMRRAIADAFGIEVDRVGLKATTLERLGALGRGEGLACQAAALLRHAEGETVE